MLPKPPRSSVLGKLIPLAKPTSLVWWNDDLNVVVRWEAQRYGGLPMLLAYGELLAFSAEDDEYTAKVGSISIAKVSMWSGYSVLDALDEISGDLLTLGSVVFDADGHYTDEFFLWFDESFGGHAAADPVFIDDISIESGWREPRKPLAARAVVEAAAAFGSASSPIVGFSPELVGADMRSYFRDRGLFDWAEPLGAKTWKDALVAPRPQE
jgi:hypothetical protein